MLLRLLKKSKGEDLLKRAIAAAACLLVSGCITPPKSKVAALPFEAPEAWKTSEEAGSFDPQGWVASFNDPQLFEILREALAHNYDLQAAAGRLEAARATAISNGSSVWPTLNLSTSGNESRRSSASGISQTPTSQTFGLLGRLNWELDLWGKLRNGYKGDIADWQASQADYAAARLSIAARVAGAWYDAIEASKQLELAKDTLKAFEESQSILEENFRRGTARALEVRLVRANVASNRSSYEQRLRSQAAASRVLETLLGRYPANEIALAAEMPEISDSIPAGLPSELLLRRPDLIVAERELAAAEQRKKESSKARLPSISLTASRGTSARELKDITEFMDLRVWSRSYNIAQPLFQGRRLSANAKRSKANYEIALASYAQAALTAFREVENALANQASFERDLASQRIATEESIAAEQLAWEEYQRGLVDITAALDAVRRSINARRALIQVTNQRIQGRIDLYLALGGGFDLELDSR